VSHSTFVKPRRVLKRPNNVARDALVRIASEAPTVSDA